jgi:hypothetical protein
VVLAVALAGWMTRAAIARPAPLGDLRRDSLIRPVNASSPAHVQLARVQHSAGVTPLLLERSPFEFRSNRRLRDMRPAGPARIPDTAITTPAAEVTPALPTLVGIAEQNGPTGMVRTGIFTDPDGVVHFALAGQMIGRFRIAAVESSCVVLVDPRGGVTSTVRLY